MGILSTIAKRWIDIGQSFESANNKALKCNFLEPIFPDFKNLFSSH